MIELAPPLPPPLSHEGITFVTGEAPPKRALNERTIAAIAAALQQLLPPGDFITCHDGTLMGCGGETPTPWGLAARNEALRKGQI